MNVFKMTRTVFQQNNNNNNNNKKKKVHCTSDRK